MAQATAVQTKIAMIATMRFNMVVCVSTLSAAPPNLCPEVGHVKYFSLQSETGRNFGMQASVVCFCSGRSSDRYPMQRRPSQAGPSGSRARRGRILPWRPSFVPQIRAPETWETGPGAPQEP